MSTRAVEHPARFSSNVLDIMHSEVEWVQFHLRRNISVLDPFGGIGGVHMFQRRCIMTFCIEIEQEWADQAAELGYTMCRDFFEWSRDTELKFDVVATSPTYGTRMADHHDARDGSKRITYKHKLGRDLSPNNSGAMQWGDAYRAFHARAWARCHGLLNADGYMILNISDHVRKGVVVEVADWHRGVLEALGFVMLRDHLIDTPRMRYGQNHAARVEHEHVMIMRKGPR